MRKGKLAALRRLVRKLTALSEKQISKIKRMEAKRR
jgi:hypothetical protein